MSHVIRLILLAIAIYSNAVFANNNYAQGTTNILFIGNSFTGANHLPSVLKKIATANNKQLTYAAQIKNGTSLYQHWHSGDAQKLILSKNWDYVVLQDASGSALEHPEKTLEYGIKFVDLIKQQGATALLFNTWAYNGTPTWVTNLKDKTLKAQFEEFIPHMAEKTNALYQSLSDASGAKVVTVGQYWQHLAQQSNNVRLYADDNSHPSPLGTYFSAILFYKALYGEAPKLLPNMLEAPYNQTRMDEMQRIEISQSSAALMLKVLSKPI
ncbi:DUF4886 domain-containing protein [Pseudoalteromonas sp. S16_S37]|uniref:DUF4886 domain-containing protein n=1 Tax=Pseudoalteromonas sp. S16_S37 TaxID=2720228 RepID=UPI001680A3E6|nr:DUF4886 domain-containing protein [Pseudoalteromonas sp. S16_S37]MBD1584260.1 hypothetical protein [Pseudoalteromonas sp. S16_S37]